MKLNDLLLLYEYNRWVNQRILDTSAKLTHEQRIAPAACSFGSLHGTLIHTLDTEYGWRRLCQDNITDGFEGITEADVPTLEALQARWQTETQAMQDFLHSLNDAELDRIVRYTVSNGVVRERVLWHCLWHVVNHGTQHRSEAAMLLTNAGQSPGNLDFTVFMNERAGNS